MRDGRTGLISGNVAGFRGSCYSVGMDRSESDATANSTGRVFFGDRIVKGTEKTSLVQAVFDGVADRYDLMNDLMSAGVHRRWKQVMVEMLNPTASIQLADVAGGTGDIAFRVWNWLTRRGRSPSPSCRVTVCDITESMVARARDRALNRGITRGVDFIVADAEILPLASASQDAVTNAFGIRNVTDPLAALHETRRVLRRGGRFLCLEFGGPVAPGLDRLYDTYTSQVLPRLGQLVTTQGASYRYLAESIRRFPDRDVFAGQIEEAGLDRVRVHVLSGGIVTLYSAWRL